MSRVITKRKSSLHLLTQMNLFPQDVLCEHDTFNFSSSGFGASSRRGKSGSSPAGSTEIKLIDPIITLSCGT